MMLFYWGQSELAMGKPGISQSTSRTQTTRRFSLVKHPKLMEICKEKDIAVEVCPISYVSQCYLDLYI